LDAVGVNVAYTEYMVRAVEGKVTALNSSRIDSSENATLKSQVDGCIMLTGCILYNTLLSGVHGTACMCAHNII